MPIRSVFDVLSRSQLAAKFRQGLTLSIFEPSCLADQVQMLTSWPQLVAAIEKRPNLQTLAPRRRPKSSRILQELVPVVSQRFPESLGGHLGPFWSLPGSFPHASLSFWRPLGEARRRWNDRSNSLEAHWSRWTDKSSSLRLPGAVGSTKIVFSGPPGIVHSGDDPLQPAGNCRREAANSLLNTVK